MKPKAQSKAQAKPLVASWFVYVAKGNAPFVVGRTAKDAKLNLKREGELKSYAWFFSTRQKARDFAWQMNAALFYAIGEPGE